MSDRDGLWGKDAPARTSLSYNMVTNHDGRKVPQGPPLGVRVHLTCPVCGREVMISFPWNEVFHLLKGGGLAGVLADGNGWRCVQNCPGTNCMTAQGRTVINYRVFYDDFKKHADNMRMLHGQRR